MKKGGLLHAVSSAMGARVGMAVLNFGLFWMLSHQLGTAALGGYSVLMNVWYLAAMLPLLGLSGPLTRRAATDRQPEALRREISNALWFALPVTLLLAALIAVAGAQAYGEPLRLPFLLLGLSLLPSAVTLVTESTLIGLERMADVSRVQFAEAALRTGLSVLAIHHGAGLTGVFAVWLGLRVAAAGVYQFHPALPRFSMAAVSREVQRRNWGEVPVFLGIVLMAAVTARVDMLLLSRIEGLHEVGIYAAAARLYEASLMLPTIAAMAMMPTLARLFQDAPDEFRRMLLVALRVNLGLGFALALGVAALAQPLIDLLYKPEVAAAAPVLRWLIFGAVLMTLDQILSSTMMAAKAQRHDLAALGIALGSLVLGLALLVPHWHATGAAMAVTLALVGRVGYRLRWVVRLMALDGLALELARLIGCAGGAVGVMLLALGQGPWVALPAAWLAYAALLRLSGAWPPGALRRARAAWRARGQGAQGPGPDPERAGLTDVTDVKDARP